MESRLAEVPLHPLRRHDHGVHQLKRFSAREGWSVKVEPHIRGDDGILKKSVLLLQKGRTAIIADVAVNWEYPNLPSGK